MEALEREVVRGSMEEEMGGGKRWRRMLPGPEGLGAVFMEEFIGWGWSVEVVVVEPAVAGAFRAGPGTSVRAGSRAAGFKPFPPPASSKSGI